MEDGGAPNEEEFSRKDNGEAFNISEFVSFLPTLYNPEMLLEGSGGWGGFSPLPANWNLGSSEKRTEREIEY